MGAVGAAAITGGAGLAGGLLGMIGAKRRERRAVRNQMGLMNHQRDNQMQLNMQGFNLQKQLWEETQIGEQMRLAKEQGLNPSLLYGQGGQGGTTGSQGGGSASGGQAPSPMPMEVGMAAQAAQTAANIKLIESQARKNNVEADKTEGVDTELGQEQILNTRIQTELNEILKDVKSQTKEDDIEFIEFQVDRLVRENESLGYKNQIDKATIKDQTNLIKEQAIGELLNNDLKRVGVTKTEQEIKKIANEIRQGWEKIRIDNDRVINENRDNRRKLFDSQRDVRKLQQEFILGYIGKQIDMTKLSIEQQKILTNIFNNILGTVQK